MHDPRSTRYSGCSRSSCAANHYFIEYCFGNMNRAVERVQQVQRIDNGQRNERRGVADDDQLVFPCFLVCAFGGLHVLVELFNGGVEDRNLVLAEKLDKIVERHLK